jgi:hypothetical protein
MSLGDVIRFRDGSYDVRSIVDGRYVVRIRNRKTGVEAYEVWTPEEREEFDRNQLRALDTEDRACQIYERHLAGETYASLGREYGISSGRVGQIYTRQARKEKATKG